MSFTAQKDAEEEKVKKILNNFSHTKKILAILIKTTNFLDAN